MEKYKINSFKEFLDQIELLELLGYEINLFRGQSSNKSLLPSICRNDPTRNTLDLEKLMLDDFKRRSPLLISNSFENDWDWLVYAQHFGLKTRLLDWTSNPLVALWFACQNQQNLDKSSYLYVLSCDQDLQVDLSVKLSPFEITNTRILRPTLNNQRIVAQSGWFTAHTFSKKDGRFVTLQSNKKIKSHLTEFEITSESKKNILIKLSMFGVNSRTVFADVNGLSMHLNWKYLYR